MNQRWPWIVGISWYSCYSCLCFLSPLAAHSVLPAVVVERRDVFSHVSLYKYRYAKDEVCLDLPGNRIFTTKILLLPLGCPQPSSGRWDIVENIFLKDYYMLTILGRLWNNFRIGRELAFLLFVLNFWIFLTCHVTFDIDFSQFSMATPWEISSLKWLQLCIIFVYTLAVKA